jgi:hypothetical protein
MDKKILLQFAGDFRPWSDTEAAQLRRQAQRLLVCDYRHGGSVLERENCGACVLHGYQSPSLKTDIKLGYRPAVDAKMPNYSGWMRVFVQATGSIPDKYQEGFEHEITHNDNTAYLNALKRDITTFTK